MVQQVTSAAHRYARRAADAGIRPCQERTHEVPASGGYRLREISAM
jgi:hypothetical protein